MWEGSMGLLIDGQWQERDYDTSQTGGRFMREDAQFRQLVAPGSDAHPPAPGRYHLYVGLACPWAHRVLIVRALKGLEAVVPVSVVHWAIERDGWTFAPGPGVIGDPQGARLLRDVYTRAEPAYTGRVTVPVLWDKHARTIVNNESADIMRILNGAFDQAGAASGDYYPAEHRAEIDLVNERVYATVNNGVYKAGFATTQAAYEEAVTLLFDSLDWLEARLARQDWLVGGVLTEADIRLFTTLVRFDPVYYAHFKCNIRRLTDYPNLMALARRLHALPKVAATIDMFHIKQHYYGSQRTINPMGIVPLGPDALF
jgi:putative glutathione S-transferase